MISVEKPLYNRAGSKGTAGSRLSACASVLRTAVDVFLRNLRTKSIRAIVDHITETLPVPGEGLWEPLSVDYTKCLAALLHHPAHVEHLSTSEWGKLMSFCLRILGVADDEDSQLGFRSSNRSTLDDYLDASGRSTPSIPASSLAIREKHAGSTSVTVEIIVCVQLLTSSPNAPVQANAEKILQGLAEFVKSSPIAGSAHQAAFNSINTIISRILFDQSDLVREFLLDTIPVIRHLWNTKLMGLKDELLGTIMFCTIILADTARRDPSESLSRLVERLIHTLHSEYIKRPEKEILQIDEVVLYSKSPVTGPRLGNPKSEHNWTVIWTMSTLFELLDDINIRLSTPRALHELSAKKQRLSSATGDILRDSFSSSGTKSICALQLIPFLLKTQTDIETRRLLQRLIPGILDDNGTISSWTLVAVSRFAMLYCFITT